MFDGEQFPCLEVTKDGEECVLENRWVKVVNMDGSKLYNITNAMKYDCHMANDSINGAYSPALDAFFIGTRIGTSAIIIFLSLYLYISVCVCVYVCFAMLRLDISVISV